MLRALAAAAMIAFAIGVLAPFRDKEFQQRRTRPISTIRAASALASVGTNIRLIRRMLRQPAASARVADDCSCGCKPSGLGVRRGLLLPNSSRSFSKARRSSAKRNRSASIAAAGCRCKTFCSARLVSAAAMALPAAEAKDEAEARTAALNSSGNPSAAGPAKAEWIERTHDVTEHHRQAGQRRDRVRQLVQTMLDFEAGGVVALPFAAKRVTFGN